MINLQGFLKSDAMPNSIKKIGLGCILMLWLGGSSSAQDAKTSNKIIPAFHFEVNDSVAVDVDLTYTKKGYPMYYTAHLETGVCSDGLCKPISITIRWDLLGQFISYHTASWYSLTKFDHIEFTDKDHDQLHRILSDTAAILRDYEVDDMIDTDVYLRSQQIDAVTRPTSPTFSAATVEGALYTVYTLWHFTNGPIRSRMRVFTTSLMSDSAMVKNMLNSGNRDYVGFVLKNITEEQHRQLSNDIIKLISSKDTYIPHFALAQLKDSIMSLPDYQQQLVTYFPHIDNSVKNALLDRLATVQLDRNTVLTLLSILSSLSESQIRKIFSIIGNNKVRIDKEIREKLTLLSHGPDHNIAQQARNTLLKMN